MGQRKNKDSEIESVINNFNKKNKYIVKYDGDIEKTVAQALADGKIVAKVERENGIWS